MESKRQLQVGEMIKRNFSYVLQSHGSFIYGPVLVSVTNVVMSPDMAQCKIYLSIYGTEEKEEVLFHINEHLPQLKNELVHRIRKHVRRIPTVAVYMDETLDEMYKIDELFQNIKKDS
jgi:ribosome-binding factor A